MSGYNYAGIIVGDAQAGKTVLARTIVARFLRERPSGIVLAHDPCGEYDARPYPSASVLRKRIGEAQRAGESMPRVMSVGGLSEEVTALALEMGASANRAKVVRRPILVVYDEGSLLSSSGRTFISALDQEALAIRRHRGVGSLYLLQQAHQLPEPFWLFATNCYLFRSPAKTTRRVEDVFLREPGSLDAVRSLGRYEYVELVRGTQFDDKVK